MLWDNWPGWPDPGLLASGSGDRGDDCRMDRRASPWRCSRKDREQLAPCNRARLVIAHSGLSGSCSGMFAASTKRRTSSTEARLAFAVLTRERNAA